MASKKLVLLSDNYPNSNGEFFLDDEMHIIAEQFEEIIILCVSQHFEHKRAIPPNAKVIKWLPLSFVKRIFFTAKSLLYKPMWQEFFSLKKLFKIKPNWLYLKILVADYVRSSQVIESLSKQIEVDPHTHILYSYWLDYKALAIARIRKKTGCVAIARCHRWDVYFYANNPPYLPYRPYIFENLTQIFSISEHGITYTKQLHKYINPDKLKLSKLGKINNFKPNHSKLNSDLVTICSCSTLTPVKRVDLIIDFIQILSQYKSIRWIHFGDGILKDSIQNKAKEHLKNIDYQFMGVQPNTEILKFYRDNYVDLFINFSESEGIPVSIMEAQSAGIPVLATAVGGTPEIVNNENGFLVDKDFDMCKVSSTICNYLESPQSLIIQKRILSYQNWEQNYNAYKNYLDFGNKIRNLS